MHTGQFLLCFLFSAGQLVHQPLSRALMVSGQEEEGDRKAPRADSGSELLGSGSNCILKLGALDLGT